MFNLLTILFVYLDFNWDFNQEGMLYTEYNINCMSFSVITLFSKFST